MEKLSREDKYRQMHEALNEKQWRQYVAMEAKERGNIAEMVREASSRRNTIKRGMQEIAVGDLYKEGERIRKKGGGRKSLAETDPSLVADLEELLEAKGDPMSDIQWTTDD